MKSNAQLAHIWHWVAFTLVSALVVEIIGLGWSIHHRNERNGWMETDRKRANRD